MGLEEFGGLVVGVGHCGARRVGGCKSGGWGSGGVGEWGTVGVVARGIGVQGVLRAGGVGGWGSRGLGK